MLEVISPAGSLALTTLEAVKVELGISGTDQDAALEVYIAQASDAAAAYCNRVFGSEEVAETFRFGRQSSDLVLTRYPVTAVVSIVENGETLAEADYQLDPESGVLARLRSGGLARWSGGLVVATYTGGYELPAGAPASLARAAVQMVATYSATANRGDPLLKRENVDGVGEFEYFSPRSVGLPAEVESLLAPFRRLAGFG